MTTWWRDSTRLDELKLSRDRIKLNRHDFNMSHNCNFARGLLNLHISKIVGVSSQKVKKVICALPPNEVGRQGSLLSRPGMAMKSLEPGIFWNTKK